MRIASSSRAPIAETSASSERISSANLNQPRAEPRRIVALEHRDQFAANPIAQKIARRIRRVLHERNRARLQVFANVGARNRKHRTNQPPRPALGHRRHPGRSGTTHQTHQDCLGLIIAMVSQSDKIRPHSIGRAAQKFAPSVARPLLEIGAGNHAKPLGPLDMQLKPEPRAHRPHKLFIAIRFFPAKPMVQMRGHELQSHPLAQREQRRHKRDRIPTAGKPDDDRRTAPNACTHQAPPQSRQGLSFQYREASGTRLIPHEIGINSNPSNDWEQRSPLPKEACDASRKSTPMDRLTANCRDKASLSGPRRTRFQYQTGPSIPAHRRKCGPADFWESSACKFR